MITDYMISQLRLTENLCILEPSAGDGVFIEKLLNNHKNIKVDAFEINPEAVNILNSKFSLNKNIKIFYSNTLTDDKLDSYSDNGGFYDRIIGNPPYGGWIDHNQRLLFKEKYYGHYVKETYGLFLIRSLLLLKEGGILSFIIPDTFLYINRHKKLREFILNNTKIIEIVTFNSKFFPNVNFGYSELSIITLKKSKNNLQIASNNFYFYKGLKDINDLCSLQKKRELSNCFFINQFDVLKNHNYSFLINIDGGIKNLINTHRITLGFIADCVTGLYVGNNAKYIKARSKEVKNSKNYCLIRKDEIDSIKNLEYPLDGFSDEKYIPLVKGSSQQPYIRSNDDWFVNWSDKSVLIYKTDSKARFQNSRYYFKKGIVVPMVKSSKINATLIESRVFDQSLVGIFPFNQDYLLYLLALLNSDIIKKIINTINPTVNNSANYLKKIPIIIPDNNTLLIINCKVEKIIDNCKSNNLDEINKIQNDLDSIITSLYQYSFHNE